MAVTLRDTRRRWITVACAAAVLVALPFGVRALPVHASELGIGELYDRVMASGDRAYTGYVVSTGTAGLPELPQLGEVSKLLNGDTTLRVWYAAPDRWRVDQIGTATERDLYQTPTGQTIWDFGNNQIIQVVGQPPVHLPRGADLVPPDLARRLLSTASPQGGSGTLSPLPARRIAGIDAAGLRVTPTAQHTTIGSVDVWADPASGLPVRVEITGRGATVPILASQFAEVNLAVPDASVLTAPAARPGVGFSVTATPDLIAGLGSRNVGGLPATLAGQSRSADITGLNAVAVYGTGLARFVVVVVPRRTSSDATGAAVRAGGTKLTFPGGDGVVLSASVFSVLVMDSTMSRRGYVLAGLVDSSLLTQAGAELSSYVGARR